MMPTAFHAFALRPIKRRHVALVLHGCGVFDGTEIHEAISMLIHLSKQKVNVTMFAPNTDQMHVINHLKGEPMNQNRNVLIESARLARGNISALDELDVAKYDALLIPGGFGVAKNLSDFADKNTSCTLNKDLESTLVKFHSAGKPIGLCCIAPVLAARCIPGIQVTVGKDTEDNGRWPYAGTAQAVKTMGAKHVNCNVTDIVVDEKNKIVTTPAYMCGVASVSEVFDGIGKLVEAVIRL